MPKPAFDRFHRYPELTGILQGFVRERPDLFSLQSIGKSYEGRDIWVVTATNAATGPAAGAFWECSGRASRAAWRPLLRRRWRS